MVGVFVGVTIKFLPVPFSNEPKLKRDSEDGRTEGGEKRGVVGRCGEGDRGRGDSRRGIRDRY